MKIVSYLDTWVLREVIAKDPYARHASERRFARLHSGVYVVKVLRTVLGEFVATVMRDFRPSEWAEKIDKVLQAVAEVADPDTCLPPPDPKAAELAMLIMANVEGMTKTDALLVAQALLDPESQKFVTNDRLITTSTWLVELERTMRQNGERSKRLKFDDRL